MIPYHGYDYAAYNAAAAAAAADAHYNVAVAAHHGGLVGGGGLQPPLQGPRIFFKIPRVVPKQRERFETQEIFKRNARDQEVRYTLYRERPLHERQAKFQQGCREGHVEMSHSSTGLSLLLAWNPHDGFARNGCDFAKEPGKAHISASLILNGVAVKWVGHIDLERLEGTGRVEFDHQLAKAEDEVLQQQVQFYTERLKDIEERTQLKKMHL